MTTHDFRERLASARYPIRIRTRDGREYDVDRRDGMTVAMGAVHVVRDGFDVVLSLAELGEVFSTGEVLFE